MDWNNIDLNSGYERDRNILDGITAETLRREFDPALESAVNSEKEVFEANLENYVKKAKEERKN